MASDRIRVVIIDDHKQIRATWKMILERHPQFLIIGEGSSGADAISIAKELNPDVMLLDINMSPVNGFEATRKIVRQSPTIKIIGISINNQPSYARNIMQLGAKGYVTKNSSREEMYDAIFKVFQGEEYICEEVKQKMEI